MMIEPVDRCITALKSKRNYDDIIYFLNNVIQQGLAAASRIFGLLEERSDIQDSPSAIPIEAFEQRLYY